MTKSFCGKCKYRQGRFKSESNCSHPANIREDDDWYGGVKIYGKCQIINKDNKCPNFMWIPSMDPRTKYDLD
jgi:hypothetical protein